MGNQLTSYVYTQEKTDSNKFSNKFLTGTMKNAISVVVPKREEEPTVN